MDLLNLLYKTNKKWGEASKKLSPLFDSIGKILETEYNSYNVFPRKKDIFNAFKINPEDVKIILLGQDPYHGHNQADGLAFSCKKQIPPSLQVIFCELERTDHKLRIDPDLSDWREQGVLLLNTILTVRKGRPMSHSKLKWQEFTHRVIKSLGEKGVPIIAMGNEAQTLMRDINKHKTMTVFESKHPAADTKGKKLSFYGSGVFDKCNSYLISKGEKPINWFNETNSTKSTFSAVFEGFN